MSAMRILLGFVALAITAGATIAAPYATDWVQGHNSKARLIVGGAPSLDGKISRYAAIEIALQPGWKTYWRQPGSAGGIPPQISWQGSSNVKGAVLQFPAPKRMIDPSGQTIGYKTSVVLPLLLQVSDPSQPVQLDLKAFFGVCREICIPAQANFKVTALPSLFQQTPPALANSLAKVPAVGQGSGVGMPTVKAVASHQSAGKQVVVVDVVFPNGADGADLFAETGDLLPLAMTQKVKDSAPGQLRFQLPIEDAAQWKALGQHGLVLTVVSSVGSREIRVPRP